MCTFSSPDVGRNVFTANKRHKYKCYFLITFVDYLYEKNFKKYSVIL